MPQTSTRNPLVFILSLLLAAAGTAAASGNEDPKPNHDDRGEVVGHVDGEPVYASEVLVHLRPPPPRIGPDPVPDPRRKAFEEAVRLRLLVREAGRRKIEARAAGPRVVEAQLVQAVVRQELEKRGIQREAISDVDARRFYDENLSRIQPVESAHVAALVVDGADLAERLLQAAAKASDEEFQILVREHSRDDASRARDGHLAVIDKHGGALAPELVPVAIGIKEEGGVGLAVSGGRFFILRSTRVVLEEVPWSERTAAYVRNLKLDQLRRETIAALVDELGRDAVVVVREQALEKLSVPSWDEYLQNVDK